MLEHHWERRERSEEMAEPNIVRKLMAATIVNAEFLKGLRTIWKENLVGPGWLWLYGKSTAYLDEFGGKAPGRNIEALWEADTILDPEIKADLGRLFTGLSEEWEEYEKEPYGLNPDLLLDMARDYFEKEDGLRFSVKYEEAREAGDKEQADKLLKDHLRYLEKLNSSSGGALKGITAKELQEMDLPEPEWIVRGIIPVGFTLLAGKPKSGKSYLVLNVATQLAAGRKVFNMIETEPTEILYLGLEEPGWMTKKRINEISADGEEWPDNLHFFYEWPKLHQGGIQRLEQWVREHPNTRLIIIDVLQKVRPPATSKGKNVYAEDYSAGESLHELAKKLGIGIVALHHTKKSKEADVFDEISGSTGLVGTTDANMVLRKVPGPNQNLRQLYYQGRLMPSEGYHDLSFEDHKFYLDDLPPGYEEETPKRKISPARQAVLYVLENLFPFHHMGRKDLIEAVGDNAGSGIEKTLSQMVDDGQIIRLKPGVYMHPDNLVRWQAREKCMQALEKRKR
jgi:hypothetical protein